jgi:hypothetical protein
MKKGTYFDTRNDYDWPEPEWLEPYFLTAAGRQQAFGEQESWGLTIYGLDGTEHLHPMKGRVDLILTIQGDLTHGVLLNHRKTGARRREHWYSLGDPTKWRQWVEIRQQDQMSAALFIPFERAWLAVKEFIERDGALPKSIEWIAADDMPEFAFRPDLAI